MHPYIYKTHDGGKSWKKIVNGMPDDPINAVREDPKRKGLLFAASETSVYVSLDDGEQWQPLRLNMPATSIRDVIIKDNDLVVATHGRGFWILDDITPLRQINAAASGKTILFKPETAIRVRWSLYTDTPLPPDEPAGQNPPDGAIIDYYLKENAAGTVTLSIKDAKGNLVRQFSSTDTLYKIPDINIPLYWIRPQQLLSAEAGSHRFIWALHYTPLNLPPSFPISAVYKNTAPSPTSPWVMPGDYTIELSVNGQTFSQLLKVNMDPRVKTSLADLQLQENLSSYCYEKRKKITEILNEMNQIRSQAKELQSKVSRELSASFQAINNKIDSIENSKPQGKMVNLTQLYNSFASLFNLLQEADMPPTTQAISAVNAARQNMESLEKNWNNIKTADLEKINDGLKKANLPSIKM